MSNNIPIPETFSVDYDAKQGVVFNIGNELSRSASPENVGQVFFLGIGRPMRETMWASENSLKDWDSPEEDKAWAGL